MSKSAAFPGSAESTPRSYRSKKTNSDFSQNTRHSIFRPDSPTSTVTDGGSTIRDTPQSTARYTPQSTPRYSPQSTARSLASSVAERIRTSSREDNYSNSLMNNEIEAHGSPTLALDTSDMIYNSMTEPALDRDGLRNGGAQARASTSNHKDLNATNNMLPQNFESRKPPKLELRTMQNSYQNPTYNVNKTPVNEVLPSFKTPISKNQAEDYIKKVNMAACVIQNAFRRYVRRRKALRASEAAMKRLLAQKREDFTQRQEAATSSNKNQELDRKLAREEKAKQARKAAIEVCKGLRLGCWCFDLFFEKLSFFFAKCKGMRSQKNIQQTKNTQQGVLICSKIGDFWRSTAWYSILTLLSHMESLILFLRLKRWLYLFG